ncbi:G-type lectin S-receptor-like serine/threonine-protein kinase CES101 [Senna tora]|uniref:G-type lectin S-receptor-like serine/threonine-protein kinase CES101 n=1 Tax=Senna tora TaxID=362788 RepID=A0A834XJZ2_9FABA|nr:G-type lectin S-receptor-like serine/threonine-protein kinase CES101 [Senna tora]
MANRNQPLLNFSSAALTLDMSGVLEISGQNDEDEPIILYSPNNITNNTGVMATLLDTGNFVLQQIYPNESVSDYYLWQSFDFPTNTLMPGMRLGSSNKTGIYWLLGSDLSDLSPAPGPFTLEWEPDSKQLIIRYRGQNYWFSGVLRDDGKFENIPEEVQRLYHYNVTSNEHEQSFSFTYTTQNLEDDRNNSSPWTLYVDGKLGSEMLEIGNAGNCYGYNKDRGCQLWNQPPCRHVGDLFQVKQVRPKEEGMTIKGYDLSISDCKANCWIDCDCVGFGSFLDGVSCYIVYDQFRGIYLGNDVLTLNYLTPINLNNTRDDSEMKRTRMEHPRHGQDLEEQSNKLENVEGHQNYKTNGQQLRLFSYASILEATNSFSLENKLGEGGFGPVYKHTYLAIHEETTSSSSKKVVWIGNRNHPLLNSSSATLTLDKSGVLKILGHNDEDEPIILYCPPPPQSDKTNNNIINNNTSVMATLLDTGNFVLQQIYPNQSKGDFLWQSFDFPSNTLMPGMRLGSDNKTSISWSLASDFSDLSPAPGPFTLEWEPGSKQLIIRYRGQVYWSSGALRDDGKFENIPEEVQLLYHYNVTSNEHEQSFSFTYTTQNHEDDRNNSSPWTLYVDGMLGSEMLEIGNAGNCYGYNKDRGCQLWNQPPCRHVGDLFQVKQVRPKEEGMTIKGYDLSISDCKANCWIDCDCVGFGSFHGGVSCYVVYDQSRGLYVPNDVLTLNYLTTINPNNTRDDDSDFGRDEKNKDGAPKAWARLRRTIQ